MKKLALGGVVLGLVAIAAVVLARVGTTRSQQAPTARLLAPVPVEI